MQGNTPVAVENNRFTMPAGDVTVSATFAMTWQSLQAGLTNAREDEENPTLITLDQDCIAAATDTALTVPDGRYVTLDLNGHVLDRHRDAAKADGSVIIVECGGNLTVQDGDPTATHATPVTYTDPVTNETVTVTGGVITGGNENGSYGGGVSVRSGGTFTLSGGSVTGNTASNKGGGVYNSGTFTLYGAPAISGNTTGSAANNVYLSNTGNTITITGNLTNATPIGVTMQTIGAFTSGLSGRGTAANFTNDSDAYRVRQNSESGEAELFTPTFHAVNTGDIIGGTVTGSRATAAEGDTVTLTVAPGTGYVGLSSLTYTPENGEARAITPDASAPMPSPCPTLT